MRSAVPENSIWSLGQIATLEMGRMWRGGVGEDKYLSSRGWQGRCRLLRRRGRSVVSLLISIIMNTNRRHNFFFVIIKSTIPFRWPSCFPCNDWKRQGSGREGGIGSVVSRHWSREMGGSPRTLTLFSEVGIDSSPALLEIRKNENETVVLLRGGETFG